MCLQYLYITYIYTHVNGFLTKVVIDKDSDRGYGRKEKRHWQREWSDLK